MTLLLAHLIRGCPNALSRVEAARRCARDAMRCYACRYKRGQARIHVWISSHSSVKLRGFALHCDSTVVQHHHVMCDQLAVVLVVQQAEFPAESGLPTQSHCGMRQDCLGSLLACLFLCYGLSEQSTTCKLYQPAKVS